MNPSPGAPTLILVPTELERARLQALGGLGLGRGLIELCGFGPIAAAMRAATLLERLRPRRVLLLGIAGSYDLESLPLGAASAFGQVRLDGIGAGEGAQRLGPAQLGFAQWEDVTDQLPLAGDGPLLLTVCAASADPAQAADRHARFDAAAEDMESFGVALACRAADTPLTVARGVSNRAGERDTSAWCIDEALQAARELALELLAT